MKTPEHPAIPRMVEIRIEGNLDPNWSDWFGVMAVSTERIGDTTLVTILRGVIADQAALRGILNKIWDLNLVLISVNPIAPIQETDENPIHN